MKGLSAVQVATSILIRKNQEEEKQKAEQAREQAAADAQKATPQPISRPQSINNIALRQNWLQSMTTPFLKKQSARQRITAQNKSMKIKARNRGKL